MWPFLTLLLIPLHFTAALFKTAPLLLPFAILGLRLSEGQGVSAGIWGTGISGSRSPLAPSVYSLHSPLFTCLPICPGMKRPLSPSPPGEKEPPGGSAAAECPPQPPEPPKPKRERKRPSYTLCDVCNIQLNSAAQAQVHCGGRAHQRRLRQLSLGKTPLGPGQCGGALLPQIWFWAPVRGSGSVASLCGVFWSGVPSMGS